MWLMTGLAVVIVLIILVTGHTQPAPRPSASAASSAAPMPATADRIRSYQRQLADEQARQDQLDRQQRAEDARPTTTRAAAQSTAAADPVVDENHRREYQSLFADNVSFSRRTNGRPTTTPAAERSAAAVQPLPDAVGGSSTSAGPNSEPAVHNDEA